MSKLDELLKQSLSLEKKVIPEIERSILGIHKTVILSLTEKGVPIVMEPITEKQEKTIDKSKLYYGEIRYNKDDGSFATASDIYMYGEINIESKDDIDVIKRFKLLHPKGSFIYSNFNYDNGTFTTINHVNKWAPTYDPILWFKYNHVLIGKPQRIIVYRCTNKKNKYASK